MENIAKSVCAFDACPDWLRTRGDYLPWNENGRVRIAARLDGWNRAYSPQVFDSPTRLDAAIVDKLFACWIFHWESAGTERDGEEIARSLENGKGFLRGGNLGGNPLFDLVFAAALQRGQNLATRLYATLFSGLLRKTANGFDPRLACASDETPEWWDDFFAFLAFPRDQRDGKLAKPKLQSFAGKCGLKNWVVKPFLQFLPDWIKENLPQGEDPEASFPEPLAPPDVDEERWSALRDRLRVAAKQALAALEPEEKLAVRLYHVDGVGNNAIAKILDTTATQASRLRKEALAKYQTALRKAIMNDPTLFDEFDGAEAEFGKCAADVVFDIFAAKDDERFDEKNAKENGAEK